VFEADLNVFTPAPESFDVVASMDVLYHTGVTDDVAVLRRLRHGLRPGGLLLLNLVALEFLRSSHDLAVHTRERYTRGELLRRVRDAGLDVEWASYRVSLLFPLVAGARLASRLLPPAGPGQARSDVALPPAAVNALLLGVTRLENRLLARCPLPLGSSVFVRARRPGPHAS
jgi:SAM-dependent methyltransferase